MFSKKQSNKNTRKKKSTSLRLSVPSIVVADLNISGDLVSDGAIEIGGKVYGNIRCNIVTIRKGAYVKGDVVANELLIQGEVEGTIKARSVNLAESAEVVGEIVYSYLSIDAGANIDGSCKKVADQEAYEINEDAETSIEYIPSLSEVLDDEASVQSDFVEEDTKNDLPEVEIIENAIDKIASDEESGVESDSTIEINLFDPIRDDEASPAKSKLKKKKG